MLKNLNISNLLDLYGKMLTEKQLLAADYYYNEDLSLSEIADNLGITKQGARDLIKRAEGQLSDMEEKLGFLQKNDEYQKLFEIIFNKLEILEKTEENFNSIKEIEKIKEIVRKIQNN